MNVVTMILHPFKFHQCDFLMFVIRFVSVCSCVLVHFVGNTLHTKCFMEGYESKDSLSSVVEGQDVVLPIEDKCEYELAREACVAKLAYLLKPLKDANVELWVFGLCQCLLQ